MATSTEQPFALIYPVPQQFIPRILDEKKTIFVKYITSQAIPQRMRDCKKILFYESGPGSKKAIIGECKILYIKLMNLSEVLSEYKDDLFLNKDEFRAYSKGRDNKKMLVFKIYEIERCPLPKTLDHQITMAGEYISESAYRQLVGKT